VTVAVPVATDVTKPEVEIVATLAGLLGEMLQDTDGLAFWLPSLLVPNTVICTVLPVVPVSMVGVTGPTAIEDRMGFTKKPVQLTARANIASAAKAPGRRSLCLADDINLSRLLKVRSARNLFPV